MEAVKQEKHECYKQEKSKPLQRTDLLLVIIDVGNFALFLRTKHKQDYKVYVSLNDEQT